MPLMVGWLAYNFKGREQSSIAFTLFVPYNPLACNAFSIAWGLLIAACGDFEKKDGEEGGCLRRSEEKSNTHLSLHFSFKGSLFNRRLDLRQQQRCERAQRASKTRMPASRIGWCILPILESGILVLTDKIEIEMENFCVK